MHEVTLIPSRGKTEIIYGQGYSPQHREVVYYQELMNAGWLYSHTTRINGHIARGGVYYLHTFQSPLDNDYCCSISTREWSEVMFSKCGSGCVYVRTGHKVSAFLTKWNKKLANLAS